MLKNPPQGIKNADFWPQKRGLAKRYTGATVALRWPYGELTDSETPKRHRIFLGNGARMRTACQSIVTGVQSGLPFQIQNRWTRTPPRGLRPRARMEETHTGAGRSRIWPRLASRHALGIRKEYDSDVRMREV